MRSKLIAGNWKMHASQQQVQELLSALTQAAAPAAQLLVIPPFPYLAQAAGLLQNSSIQLGAQDCSAAEAGAFTGEVSASMLADMQASYVLIGHSERRQYHQESNELLLKKTLQALNAGLKPILCLGETLAERDAGQTLAVVSAQLSSILNGLTASQASNLILAYEPVWAIGTGLTASPEQAQEVHASLRQLVAASSLNTQANQLAAKMLILYGGSMKPDNASALLAMPDIDGGLVGGASLDAQQFLAIAAAANT